MTVIALLLHALLAWAGMRIVAKTGLNRWMGLLMAVPLINIGLLVWLALADWPVLGPPRINDGHGDYGDEPGYHGDESAPSLPPPEDHDRHR